MKRNFTTAMCVFRLFANSFDLSAILPKLILRDFLSVNPNLFENNS